MIKIFWDVINTTPENYAYRNSLFFLRNDFRCFQNKVKVIHLNKSCLILYIKGMSSARAGRIYIVFRGQRIYIHDELLDFDYIDDKGRSSRERILDNRSPIGTDGSSIHLHHINQEPDGDLEEILETVHNRNTKELHPYRNQPSKIDRNKFNSYRRAYWKYRLSRYEENEK